MTCPDTEHLLEVVLEEGMDPEVKGHLRTCRDCAATARLIREMRVAYRPEMTLPETLIESRIDLVIRLSSQKSEQVPDWRDATVAGALSFVTVLLTIVMTGSFRTGDLWGPAILCLVAAIAGVGYERSFGLVPETR